MRSSSPIRISAPYGSHVRNWRIASHLSVFSRGLPTKFLLANKARARTVINDENLASAICSVCYKAKVTVGHDSLRIPSHFCLNRPSAGWAVRSAILMLLALSSMIVLSPQRLILHGFDHIPEIAH